MFTLSLHGRNLRIIESGSGGPAVFWGCGDWESPEAIVRLLDGRNFLLVAYDVGDWNRAFSPWPAPPVFGSEGFSGGGRETLDWLCSDCIPAVEARFGMREKLLCGYSLAGLFSLWAFYETGVFSGAASCSGSLWFPGWQDFMHGRCAPPGSRVYLSLGDREEHTKNRLLRGIGDTTRAQYAALQADPHITRCTLFWESGGHFAEPEKRLARGVGWLLD